MSGFFVDLDECHGDYSEDLLRVGRLIGRCPKCDAVIHEAAVLLDDDGLERTEGGLTDWCPACGWEAPKRDEEPDDDD